MSAIAYEGGEFCPQSLGVSRVGFESCDVVMSTVSGPNVVERLSRSITSSY